MISLKQLLKKAQEWSDAVEVLFLETYLDCLVQIKDLFGIKMSVMTVGLGNSLHGTNSFGFEEESFEELGFRHENVTLLSAHKSTKSTGFPIELVRGGATCSSSAFALKMTHTVAY